MLRMINIHDLTITAEYLSKSIAMLDKKKMTATKQIGHIYHLYTCSDTSPQYHI